MFTLSYCILTYVSLIYSHLVLHLTFTVLQFLQHYVKVSQGGSSVDNAVYLYYFCTSHLYCTYCVMSVMVVKNTRISGNDYVDGAAE